MSFQIGQRPWTPEEISTDAWYDAADSDTITESGGAVSQWDDKSGNDNHLAQAFASLQPTINVDTIEAVNGDKLTNSTATNLLNSNGKTFVIMVHDIIDPTVSSSTFPYVFGIESNASGVLERRPRIGYGKDTDTFRFSNADGITSTITASTITGKSIVGFEVVDATDSYVYIDGTQEANDAPVIDSNTSLSIFHLGDITAQDQTIKFNEVIVVSDAITTENRQKLEGYLAWKWGLQANLPAGHPYKSERPIA